MHLDQEATLKSWKAVWCHQVLEVLKADPLSQNLLMVQITLSKPDVPWGPALSVFKRQVKSMFVVNELRIPASAGAGSGLSQHCSHIFSGDDVIFKLDLEREHGWQAWHTAPFSSAFVRGKLSSPLAPKVTLCLQENEEKMEIFFLTLVLNFDLFIIHWVILAL